MRAQGRALLVPALTLLLGLPILAQGTPQGRGPAKAKAAAKAAEAGAADRTGAAQADTEGGGEAGSMITDVQASEEAAATGTGITYDPEGRRDPFVSPSELMEFQDIGQCEGEGIACWLITEVSVVGVMARRSGSVALVTGPDGYGAALKAGDELYDGEVLKIDASRGIVTFRQRVNDPTRIKPYRDIEKTLSTREGGV